jgi:hypothetical protein
MSTEEKSVTFVADLQKSEEFPSGGQILITVFDDTICRIAWRKFPWNTWGVPIEAKKSE